jgi:DNA-binding transcriptional LysR family regulator
VICNHKRIDGNGVGCVLDARRLQIYVTVAAEGSFTAAAEQLYLSQSAVSQQMGILEREVGVPLMERMPRGVSLTPAGELLAARARVILDGMTSLEHELHQLADKPRRVSVGAFSTAGAHLIPLTVKAFHHRYPDDEINVVSSRADDVAAQLREGVIDVGLVWDYDYSPRPPEENLRTTPLLTDPLLVALPADHPLAKRSELRFIELADAPWIVRDHRQRYTDAFETMCRIAGFEPHVVFRTEDYQAVQGLVAAGIGVSLMPKMCVMAERTDVVTRPVSSPRFVRRVAAVSLPGSSQDQTADRILRLLLEVCNRAPFAADSDGSKESLSGT